MKTVKAKIPKSDFIKSYITLWNGGLKLTENEQKLLVAIIELYQEIEVSGTKGQYINELLFSTRKRKELMSKLNLNPQAFNNYFKGLKDKKVILESNDGYQLNPMMIPENKITFEFELI
jgi:hypothetical protein